MNNELYITLPTTGLSTSGASGTKVAAAAIHMYKLMYNYIFALCIETRQTYI
jgi:hypothetical protein